MKKIITSILLVAALFNFTGCQKYLDVNRNTDAPDEIEAVLYLPGILSAYQGMYWDIRALGPLTQMMATNNYTTFAQNYYSAGSDAGGEIWRMNYWLQGKNLENMITLSEADGAWTLAGIGYAIKAFSWDALTKYHGEAPLKQAYVQGLLSHDYDSQEEIMAQARDWAKTAIEYLAKDDEFDYGSYLKSGDIVYGGDKAKWTKFAHSVIVSDLAALSRKKDFAEKYAPELIEHAALAIDTNDSNFAVKRGGGGADAQFSAYNNFWGTYRGNLSYTSSSTHYWYVQSDYIVELMTGTVPEYDEATGERVDNDPNSKVPKRLWKLAEPQIICDTLPDAGHFDPRVAAKLTTADASKYFDETKDKDAIKAYGYVGGSFTSQAGPTGATTPTLYGYRTVSATTAVEGSGRWLFRDDAPYILLTASEIQFELAEAYFVTNRKAEALAAFKKGIELDMAFTASYLNPGGVLMDDKGEKVAGGSLPGGSMIDRNTFNDLATEYLNGPYVDGITAGSLTLSHIMMQKYVALWPWGALEAWTDLRKYHYDIDYTGEYPTKGNGWDVSTIEQKWDTNPNKVYKGFYLQPAQVEYRKTRYNVRNEGSPCYRVRPRYNSEYMWNLNSLKTLKPISGAADNYHCSIPWFAYPGDMPESL